jgi:hypothetical protein
MSLKGDKYETAEEVRFRLENTVVLYDKEPVYITRVSLPEGPDEKNEIARVFFRSLPYTGAHQPETRKYLSSRHFDLTPFKMGYMNYKGQAYFISRAPLRQNRQGLSQNTTVITDTLGRRSDRLGFANMIADKGFVDMVHGKYPDFKNAGELLGAKDCSSVAISRTFVFMIDNDLDALYLLHKGIKCGLAMKGDQAIKVAPKFLFLREEMEECRIPVA